MINHCYYPMQNITKIFKYSSTPQARRFKDKYTIGIWKIKKLK